MIRANFRILISLAILASFPAVDESCGIDDFYSHSTVLTCLFFIIFLRRHLEFCINDRNMLLGLDIIIIICSIQVGIPASHTSLTHLIKLIQTPDPKFQVYSTLAASGFIGYTPFNQFFIWI